MFLEADVCLVKERIDFASSQSFFNVLMMMMIKINSEACAITHHRMLHIPHFIASDILNLSYHFILFIMLIS